MSFEASAVGTDINMGHFLQFFYNFTLYKKNTQSNCLENSCQMKVRSIHIFANTAILQTLSLLEIRNMNKG